MIELIALLFSRLFLFAFFQAVIALLLHSWMESEKYWMLTATLANIISIILLVLLFRKEGIKYLSIFRFHKDQWKKDLMIFLGLTLLSVPLVLLPSLILSNWLWSNANYYPGIMFQPIPLYLGYFLVIAFPVTIVFAELATYFAYIMPRLEKKLQIKWVAIAIPVLFLSLQHITLPLVFEAKFIFFRGAIFLPFALMLGIALHKRPTLFPYFVILHGLMDAQAVIMLLKEMK